MSKIKNKHKLTEIIDVNSGEIVNSQMELISYNQEPDFVKMYLQDLSFLHGLTGTNNSILHSLLSKMTYDNEIILIPRVKEEMANKIGLMKKTFEKGIRLLCEKGILIKKDNNYYLVNPFLFARGSWKDIRSIRMTIKYSKEGKDIKVILDSQQEIPFVHPEITD